MICVLLLAFVSSSLAGNSFSVQESSAHVLFPAGQRGRTLTMALADFGKPKFGGTLIGKLVYPTEDMRYNPTGKPMRCTNFACQYGCDDLSTAKPPYAITKVPGRATVMMFDRGPRNSDQACYFLTKAMTAQMAGADALLVINDMPGELSTAVVPDEEAVAHLLDSLTISTAVISMEDGAFLKGLLADQSAVTIALNWTSILPRSAKVSWELWSNSNDECGTLCREQRAFIQAMKPYARSLEQSGLVAFQPHYLLWSCPQDYMESDECKTECIMDGNYCAPDPDGSFSAGYTGADVLAQNVRQLCFWQVANASGTPWMWWDYVDTFSSSCITANKTYTVACAQQVFIATGGALLLGGKGQAAWDRCVASGSPPPPGSSTMQLDLLEQELDAQHGTDGELAVTILPTIRINTKQYRGTLDASSVMRALCSAFPLGKEPSVCNEKWVSENECETGGEGYTNCRVGNTAGGSNRCVNTFSGYECQCGQGWLRSSNVDSGAMICEDINECAVTNVRASQANCSCDRCICINTPGSYKCTGELPNKCAQEYDFGGCWRDTVGGILVTACQDTLDEYRRLAYRGTLQPTDQWYKCACPTCFQPTSGVPTNLVCKPLCPGGRCVAGQCLPDFPDALPGPAPASAGTSAVGTFATALLGMVLTVGVLFALYQFVLRSRMHGEIRDIMSQYMPLDDQGRRRGPGPAGGRGSTRHYTADADAAFDPLEESAPLLSSVPLGPSAHPSSTHAGSSAPAAPRGSKLGAAQPHSSFGPQPGDAGAPAAGRRTPFGSLLTPVPEGAGPEGEGASTPGHTAAAASSKPAGGYQVPALLLDPRHAPEHQEATPGGGLGQSRAAGGAPAVPLLPELDGPL